MHKLVHPKQSQFALNPIPEVNFHLADLGTSKTPLLSCFLLLNWSFNVFKKFIWVSGDPVGILSIFCLFVFYLEPPWFFNAWQSLYK